MGFSTPDARQGRASRYGDAPTAMQDDGFAVLEGSPKKARRVYFVNHRVLGMFGITAITYFIGCGGPMGSEPIVSAGGPLVGLVAMVTYLIFITIPYAWIVAELCTAFPEDGGFAVWVLNAFGPFWGFQVGYWSWISGIFNGALLPGLFVDTALDFAGKNVHETVGSVGAYFIKAALAIFLTIPSLIGTRCVERTSSILLVLVLLPYLVFTVWGYIKADDYEDLLEVRQKNMTYFEEAHDTLLAGGVDIQWDVLINMLFWNFDGIYMMSVFGGEVSNPARVYPRAIAMVIVLTILSYLVPLPAAIVTQTPHWQFYTPDSFPFIAKTIGGQVLEGFVTISSLFSACGMFMAQMFCKTFQMSGMAEQQMIPSVFCERNHSHDTPHWSILTTLFFTLILVGVDFRQLLPMANAYSAMVHIMILFSVIQLRRTLPFAPRPTKVPGGFFVLASCVVFPIAIASYICVSAFTTALATIIILSFFIPGIVYGLFGIWQRSRSSLTPGAYA